MITFSEAPRDLCAAVTALCQRQGMADATPGRVHLTPGAVVVRLARPVIVEGEWTNVAPPLGGQTIDLLDLIALIDDFRQEAR